MKLRPWGFYLTGYQLLYRIWVSITGYDRVKEETKYKNEIAFVTDECMFPIEMTPYAIGKTYGSVYDKFNYKKYEKLCIRYGIPRHKVLRKMSKCMVIKLQLAFAFSREAQ